MFAAYVALTFIGLALLIIIPIVDYAIEYFRNRHEEVLADSAMKEKEAMAFRLWARDLGNLALRTKLRIEAQTPAEEACYGRPILERLPEYSRHGYHHKYFDIPGFQISISPPPAAHCH